MTRNDFETISIFRYHALRKSTTSTCVHMYLHILRKMTLQFLFLLKKNNWQLGVCIANTLKFRYRFSHFMHTKISFLYKQVEGKLKCLHFHINRCRCITNSRCASQLRRQNSTSFFFFFECLLPSTCV
jgi:hypothetical protein